MSVPITCNFFCAVATGSNAFTQCLSNMTQYQNVHLNRLTGQFNGSNDYTITYDGNSFGFDLQATGNDFYNRIACSGW